MQGGEQFYPSKEVVWGFIMQHGLLGSGEINPDGTPNSFWSYLIQCYNIQPTERGYWRTGKRKQLKHHQDGWTLAFHRYQMNCLLRLAKQTEQALETAEAALAESRRTHRVEVAALRTIQSHVFHLVATVY